MIFLKRSHDASKWTYVRKIQENVFFGKWCVGYPTAPAKEAFLKSMCECFDFSEIFLTTSIYVLIACFGVSKVQAFKWYVWKGHRTLQSEHRAGKCKKMHFFENGTWGLGDLQQKRIFKNDCVSVLIALKYF